MTLGLRWLHVVAALLWIGGMLFVALVLVPVVRRLEDEALRRRVMRDVGRRFRTVGWIALGVLILTGVGIVWIQPFFLYAPRFQAKMALVVVALGLTVAHDFVLGPRAGRADAGPGARAATSWLARANVLVVLGVVLMGLWLLR